MNAKFRKVEMTMSRASGYGSYYVSANYRGKQIKTHTHNSEMWDWFNDDSNKQKHHEAKKSAYLAIKSAYEVMMGM